MNFPLYTLVQNLGCSKKSNNSMKNRARVTNNDSNNRYFFALFVCNTSFKNSIIKVFLELLKTGFYVFAFLAKILVIKVFNKYTIRYKIEFHVEVT